MPRADVIAALETLTDQTLHASWAEGQRTWPHLDDAIHWLIDDTGLEDVPLDKVDGGLFQTDLEAHAVQRAVASLGALIDQLGDAPAERYVRHASWPTVVDDCKAALRAMGDHPAPPALRPIDLVWNRAALEAGGQHARRGDTALAALLRCHNEVMSGGMYFAIRDSLTSEEVAAGVAGFRHFGLTTAADVFRQASAADDDELEALDETYATAVPGDQALVDAFEAIYAAQPETFAPLPAA